MGKRTKSDIYLSMSQSGNSVLIKQPEGFLKLDNLNVDHCFNVGATYEGDIVLTTGMTWEILF